MLRNVVSGNIWAALEGAFKDTGVEKRAVWWMQCEMESDPTYVPGGASVKQAFCVTSGKQLNIFML